MKVIASQADMVFLGFSEKQRSTVLAETLTQRRSDLHLIRTQRSGRTGAYGSTSQTLAVVGPHSYSAFMKAVGIRELTNWLSEDVRLVRAGEHVMITDRGEVVAEMNPPGTKLAGGDTVFIGKGLR